MAEKLRPLILLLFALVALHPARAVDTVPELPRKLRFTVFAAAHLPALVYQEAAKPAPRYTPVVLFPSSRSPVYEYNGWDALRFEDAASHQLLAEAEVPRNISRALLIIAAWPEAPPGRPNHVVYIFDDGAASLPPGALGVLNLSDFRLTGNLGADNVDLAQGYQGPFHPGLNFNALLNTAVRGHLYRAFAGQFTVAANQRCLLILLPPYRRGSVEVQYRTLIDEPSPAPTPFGRQPDE